MTTTDADVEEFAKEYREVVRVVSLANCRLITDAAVESLAKHCPNLRSLHLAACTKVTDAGIQALVAGCSQLTSLHLTNFPKVTDEGLQAIAESCKQLTSLDHGLGRLVDMVPAGYDD